MTKVASVKAHCDRLCREIVRFRGCCQRCLSARDLECAHIRPRRFVGDPDAEWGSLRTNPANCWLLCRSCHRIVDGNAVEFTALVDKTIGRDRYETLVRLSHAPHRPWRMADWQRERERLKALLESMGKART